MNNIKLISILLCTCLILPGCSVAMVLKQPDKKNLQVLSAGISRENVVTYLGAPATTKVENEERIEIYQFDPGHSGAAKASRALIYGIGDLFTLFITEIFWIPGEYLLSKKETTVKVIYDQQDKVKDVIYLTAK